MKTPPIPIVSFVRDQFSRLTSSTTATENTHFELLPSSERSQKSQDRRLAASISISDSLEMADDKNLRDEAAEVLHMRQSGSDTSSLTVRLHPEYKKASWWSYIWVSSGQ